MDSETIHGEAELLVFRAFVEHSKIRVVPGTIEKRPRGEPDILCVIEGEGPVAFELAELCAEDIAATLPRIRGGGSVLIRTSDPSARILRTKLNKLYRSEAPIELLLYTNARLVTPNDVIIATLRPILESRAASFRRVWLLGERGAYELWRAG